MGIIYDVIRQDYHEENEEIDSMDTHTFISFYDFIELLELHTDDSMNIISLYLINEDEFLKLNFYCPYKHYCVKNHEIECNLSPFKYDSHKDEEEIEYPTENFLEDLLLENKVEGYYYHYYWKIEDLINLECIVKLGLDIDSVRLCQKAIYGNARMLIEYHKENEALLNKLKKLENDAENNKIVNLLHGFEEANLKIAQQNKHIEKLTIKLKNIEQQAQMSNDQPLHPRTANNASKIIAALTSELLNMDLTQPFANSSNGTVKAAIEIQGNTMSKGVIGNWLILAHENSI